MRNLFLTSIVLIIFSCKQETVSKSFLIVNDPHSFSKPNEAVVKHLDLDILVDFESHVIGGIASWDIEQKQGNRIIFDTRNLSIASVKLDDGKEAKFSFGAEKAYMGKALIVELRPNTKKVIIQYATSPDAAALQWLSPDQTAGKELPFLFTQGEALLTRSWIPCQDSPGIRFSYTAKVTVPKAMMALMSAVNPQAKNNIGVYSFVMDKPIPAYLMALSVGDNVFQSLGPRTGVYTEPAMLTKSAWELGELEKFVSTAEELYGPYPWGRYDALILPPSFPFGGMENPKLTFATPTIIAGDRSLTSLVAHELAHSWSGNLVTNATWNDFWMNEGFTMYFERRITEKVFGKDFADMEASLGYQDWVKEANSIGMNSPDTRLYINLENRDPDDGMSGIAYEKGYAFLRYIEEQTRRDSFDNFLKNYFHHFAFKTITTKDFIVYLKENYLSKFPKANIDIDEWVYKPGIPKMSKAPVSVLFLKLNDWLAKYKTDYKNISLLPSTLSYQEWIYIIRNLPEKLTEEQFNTLTKEYGWADSGNSEIQAAWFEKAINAGYGKQLLKPIEKFLIKVGRRKFLEPLYGGLINHGLEQEAKEIYKKARIGYHFVTIKSLDALLKYKSQ